MTETETKNLQSCTSAETLESFPTSELLVYFFDKAIRLKSDKPDEFNKFIKSFYKNRDFHGEEKTEIFKLAWEIKKRAGDTEPNNKVVSPSTKKKQTENSGSEPEKNTKTNQTDDATDEENKKADVLVKSVWYDWITNVANTTHRPSKQQERLHILEKCEEKYKKFKELFLEDDFPFRGFVTKTVEKKCTSRWWWIGLLAVCLLVVLLLAVGLFWY